VPGRVSEHVPQAQQAGKCRSQAPEGPGQRHPTNGDDGDMPKMKTHSGAGKRFRLSGTGKVMRRRANRAHYLEHKPSTRTRRLKNEIPVSPADLKKMNRLLGK
jgi:large subunit ribosomal protein L35